MADTDAKTGLSPSGANWLVGSGTRLTLAGAVTRTRRARQRGRPRGNAAWTGAAASSGRGPEDVRPGLARTQAVVGHDGVQGHWGLTQLEDTRRLKAEISYFI